MKRFLLVFLAALLALCPVCTQALSEEDPADALITEMVIDVGYYRNAAADRVSELLTQLQETDPDAWEKWSTIIDYWKQLATEDTTEVSALTDRDAVLCFAVMGYELTTDGKMKSELKHRLQTALKCYKYFPNSYILCSGKGRRTVTEASVMREWLRENGVPDDRIIVEDGSRDTCQNAVNSMALLKQYPDITGVVTVTGASHAYRVALGFQAARILTDTTLPPVIGRVSCETNLTEDSARLTAALLIEMMGHESLAQEIKTDTYKPEKLPE